MKPLTTADINDILFSNPATKRYFLGTYPACVIPKTEKRKYFFISNTASHEHSGEHWNVWRVNGDDVLFFDSFGRSPFSIEFPVYFHEFAKSFKKITFVEKQLQHPFSVACGYYCVKFVYDLSYDLKLDSFLKSFTTNLQLNDEKVNIFVDSII